MDKTFRIPGTDIVTLFRDNLEEVHTYSLAVDIAPSLLNSDNYPSKYQSIAYENSGVLTTIASSLITISGYNSLAAPQFIQFFESAVVPADDAIPALIISVPASSSFHLNLGLPYGMLFNDGISWSNSSTGPTKTIGAADCWLNALWRNILLS